ncbi:MAG: hypothetical protein WBZ36_04710 [Candidatus Nitrosopolaris sp.]
MCIRDGRMHWKLRPPPRISQHIGKQVGFCYNRTRYIETVYLTTIDNCPVNDLNNRGFLDNLRYDIKEYLRLTYYLMDIDVVLMTEDLTKIPYLLKTSRQSLFAIKQNFFGIMFVDGLGFILAFVGLINPLLAAIIHVSSELVFISNSARLIIDSNTGQTKLSTSYSKT